MTGTGSGLLGRGALPQIHRDHFLALPNRVHYIHLCLKLMDSWSNYFPVIGLHEFMTALRFLLSKEHAIFSVSYQKLNKPK